MESGLGLLAIFSYGIWAGVAAWEFKSPRSSSKEHTTCTYQVLVNNHSDGQTFKFQLRPVQEFQFQFLFFNTRTQSDCACRGNGQACLDQRVLLVSQTVVESIQLFLFEVEAQSWVKRHEPNRWALRPQKLVEASSNSTTINLPIKLPKMWMRVEKRLMVLSFVPELTRRNIQHLKGYPVFKVFFLRLSNARYFMIDLIC